MDVGRNKDINKELRLILNSVQPGEDLDVKHGKIVKKDMFSKFISSLVGSDKPSAALKSRMTEIFKDLSLTNEGKADLAELKNNLLTKVTSKNPEKRDLVVAVLCNRISGIYDKKHDEDKKMIQLINNFKREHIKEKLKDDSDYRAAKQVKSDLIGNKNLIEEPLSQEQKIHLLEAKTTSKIAKMKVLQQMGDVGRSEKGTTGTALIFDYKKDGSERLIGVFKPDASFAPFSVKMGNLVRRIFGQHSLMSMRPYAQPRAENVAYNAAQFFNILSVPPSRLTTMGGKMGVFQLAAHTFVKTLENEARTTDTIKLHEADALKKPNPGSSSTILNNPEKKITDTERNAFQEFAVLDFLIGNLDGHDENWLIGLADSSSSNKDISHIVGIDKANSFPVSNPGVSGIGGKNQYLWKKTKLAEEPFTEAMRVKMKEIDPNKVNEFIGKISETHKGFFEPSMVELFKNRAKAIQEIADIPFSTPADLATMIRDGDFAMGVRAKLNKI